MYGVVVWGVDTRALILEGGGVDVDGIRSWVTLATSSMEQGFRPILVCDSAIAIGLARMKTLQTVRSPVLSLAAMALGQTAIGTLWESMFAQSGQMCAQVLLNQDDLKIDHRKSGIRATLQTLLDMGVIPIISENELSALPPSPLASVDFLVQAIQQVVGADRTTVAQG
ncbi:hypothetical protein KV572_02425 [Pseudomonas yamanorum]|uniref:amino acid kinase family protein n=1 Tax=Pseudomonas yamanorum TaxID=515393 RepID=UPI001C47FC1B|nr:hypothetical protein [Pseudomonas yamanorum]MBV6659768.1 hypothetical protein [Pseudomonas yamanorum]